MSDRIIKDGKLDKEFGKDNARVSRGLADGRDEYMDMNNLNKHDKKVKKTGK